MLPKSQSNMLTLLGVRVLNRPSERNSFTFYHSRTTTVEINLDNLRSADGEEVVEEIIQEVKMPMLTGTVEAKEEPARPDTITEHEQAVPATVAESESQDQSDRAAVIEKQEPEQAAEPSKPSVEKKEEKAEVKALGQQQEQMKKFQFQPTGKKEFKFVVSQCIFPCSKYVS